MTPAPSPADGEAARRSDAPARKYLFGPVPSRRLGLSLGLDLVPAKTCNLDCIFCQVGRTPRTTLVRRAYVPVAAVLAEFDAWLSAGGLADCVTLSGAGEPTLHSGFGDVLRGVRERCALRTVLLSNGALLYRPAVRRAAALADLVKVSLGAWDADSFARLNRPAAGLTFERMVEGFRQFRRAFRGTLWLEVFVVPGLNDTPDQLRRVAALARTFGPDRVQLNTAVRPAAEAGVGPAAEETLAALASCFTPHAEVVAALGHRTTGGAVADADAVLALLLRHPCTAREMAFALGGEPAAVAAQLEALLVEGRVATEARDGQCYYVVAGA